mgnify:CR=1 FL=1
MVAPTNEELGSGTANSNTWLRGDRTWSEINCPLSQYMSYGSIGLMGENNTVAPNTKMDMSADVVWLKEYPAEETIITKKNTGTLTNDI